MIRKTVWRNASNDVLNWNQEQAANTTIFILKEFGPTGFLLKEEGESRAFKVFLGDPHSCTCHGFLKEKDLCKHICWVLIRKFRLPRDHEYSFQLGLIDRQIAELLQGQHRIKTSQGEPVAMETPEGDPSTRDGRAWQKEVGDDDVCPICQDELKNKRLPVTHCRFGCGNNVHISCMKVWADHQSGLEANGMVKCPLCREDFGLLRMLQEQVRNAARLFTLAEREKPDRHLGVLCNSCLTCPITGKCFKCTVCRYYYLCEDCAKKNCHSQHLFAFRTKRIQPWCLQAHPGSHAVGTRQEPGLQSSDDQASICVDLHDPVPGQVMKSLPSVMVKAGCPLLEPGQQCRLCFKSFQLGQLVRSLPCRHKFHAGCMDLWVQRTNECPLDGQVIYNPLMWGRSKAQTATKLELSSPTCIKQPELFVPGIRLQVWTRRCTPTHCQPDDRKVMGPPKSTSLGTVLHATEAFHINCTPIGTSEVSTQHKESPQTGSYTGQGSKCHGSVPVKIRTRC